MSKDIVIGIQVAMDSSYYNRTGEPLPWVDITKAALSNIAKKLQDKYGDSVEIRIADDYIDVAAIVGISEHIFGNVILFQIGHTLLENLHLKNPDNLVLVSDQWGMHYKFKPRHRSPPPGVLLFSLSGDKRVELKNYASKIEFDFGSTGCLFSKSTDACVIPDDIHKLIQECLGVRLKKDCRLFKLCDPYEDDKAMRELGRMF
jgi:hypothetical protein